jgi:hypothetical protein
MNSKYMPIRNTRINYQGLEMIDRENEFNKGLSGSFVKFGTVITLILTIFLYGTAAFQSLG